jgi:hypothetical protein
LVSTPAALEVLTGSFRAPGPAAQSPALLH